MHNDGEVRSRKSSSQRLKERTLLDSPPTRAQNVSTMDQSRIKGPGSDSVSHSRIYKNKKHFVWTWQRCLSMNMLLAALATSAILQIIISPQKIKTIYSKSKVLRHGRASMNTVDEFRFSSFDRKPISLVLVANGLSVEKIRLSWFKIEEKEPKQYDTKSVNYKTNLAGFRHSQRVNGENCVAMYDWQETFKPTCNNIHELDIEQAPRYDNARIVANGLFRDVWDFKENVAGIKTSWAFKTLRMNHEIDWDCLSEQARDATISEQLTFSPNVANIYNYCGLTSMYDFAHNGTLDEHYQHLAHSERLRIAAFISRGLADAHTLGGGKYAPLAHTDIAVRQFVNLNGNFLLNDFNTAALLLWDEKNQKPCKWSMYRPEDKNRAPEEYIEERNPIDEKMDVYSLGNIYYKFLMNKRKYNDIHTVEAVKLLRAGDVVALPEEIEKSKDPVHVALAHAFRRSQVVDPEKRASAKELADYLEDAWEKYQDTVRKQLREGRTAE